MTRSNVRNFVIYYHEETSTLFQHFEWIGHWKSRSSGEISAEEERRLFDLDMRAIAGDPVTRKWWRECEPCQEPFSQWPAGTEPPSEGGSGPWWAPLECVAHCGHWPVAYGARQRDPDFRTMAQSPA
jgi:L-rhamnose mutarotase